MSDNLQDGNFDSQLDLLQISSLSIHNSVEEECNAATSSNCNLNTAEIEDNGSSFFCTICREEGSSIWDSALIPDCKHTFCLQCLLSWTQVSEHCPNCKISFTSLFVHRDLQGNNIVGPLTVSDEPAWALESVTLLRRASWVSLQEVHTPLYDIEPSFQIPGDVVYAAPNPSPAPHYAHEEYEDELENAFWEEEQQDYDELIQSMRGTRRMTNRRFGQGGYIASGRMQATRRAPQTRGKSQAGPSGSSSRTPKQPKKLKNANNQASASGSSSGGGRKKKVKKKSRAGIAAAQAAAAAKAAAEVAVEANVQQGHGNNGSTAGSSSSTSQDIALANEC